MINIDSGFEDENDTAKVNPSDPTTIPKFVDPLPIPDIAKPIMNYNYERRNILSY